MADLLDLLGGEWSTPALPAVSMRVPPTAKEPWVRHLERHGITHGCAECGLVPAKWDDAIGAYIDGMGRITRCGYCGGCAGTGWTLLRDPWTGAPVSSWFEVPCPRCYGGWNFHAWDCAVDHRTRDGSGDVAPRTVTVYGVRGDGVPFFPGEVVAPDPRMCLGAAA